MVFTWYGNELMFNNNNNKYFALETTEQEIALLIGGETAVETDISKKVYC